MARQPLCASVLQTDVVQHPGSGLSAADAGREVVMAIVLSLLSLLARTPPSRAEMPALRAWMPLPLAEMPTLRA